MPAGTASTLVAAAPSGAAKKTPVSLKFQAKCKEVNRADMPLTLDEEVEEVNDKGVKVKVMKPHRVMRNVHITTFQFQTLGDVTNLLILQTLQPSGFEVGKEYVLELHQS